MHQLDQMVEALKAGESSTVRFLRNGEEQTAKLQF
jgi:hypothetical protein